MHASSSYFLFPESKALNTAVLFTDPHLNNKNGNKNHHNYNNKNQKQNRTLLKNYKPARKYSGSVYKLIAIFFLYKIAR